MDLKNRLEETCNIAQEELLKAQEIQKQQYDKSAQAKSLEVGQKVLLLLPTKANKLLLQWRGPYQVIEKMSSVNYSIQVGSKQKTFHVNMLKPYIERVDETGDHAHDKDLSISQPPEEIGSDSDLQDAEEVTDCEDLHTSASEEAAAKPEIAATVVLKDGDGAVDDSKLIEVCPLTSMQSWEDVKVNDQLSKSQKVEVRKLLQEQ